MSLKHQKHKYEVYMERGDLVRAKIVAGELKKDYDFDVLEKPKEPETKSKGKK